MPLDDFMNNSRPNSGHLMTGRKPQHRKPHHHAHAAVHRSLRGLLVCFFTSLAANALAGMSGENVVVVVNANSAASRTIANHYVHLRNIPTRNVILLDDVPEKMVTTLADFRERILRPLLKTIDERGIAGHVRCIAYSAGFPYAVNVSEHGKRLEDKNLRKAFTATASINGLTYLYRFILDDSEKYLSPAPNLYVRAEWDRNFENPFLQQGPEQSAFDSAQQALRDKDFAAAADTFQSLFEAHPTEAPLAILAARAHARNEDNDAAMQWLLKAEKADWVGGSWLAEVEDLQPLKPRADFQALVKRLGDTPAISQLAVGFDSARGWTRNGWWTRPDSGVTYLPSCMLAVTRGAGTTVSEAMTYLTRAVDADFTQPQGTVYLTKTSDVRTKTRFPQFADAMLYLKWLGRDVSVERAKIPQGKDDVIGVTFGTAGYDWPASGSTLLPGGIGDNLTSTSGVMQAKRGQTKLTELLKAGAAIASGTVTEPYALQFKFPLPSIHAYYAEGLTAIEAYYLSLASPYQLLIVGDPLCQPFAQPPQSKVSGKLGKADDADAVIVSIGQPDSSTSDPGQPASTAELYLDGKRLLAGPTQKTYRLKLGNLPGGRYELRVVLIGEPRIAPRRTIRTWFSAPGLLTTPTAKLVELRAAKDPKGDDQQNAVAILQLAAVGADSIRIEHFGTTIATLNGEQGKLDVQLQGLGFGPIRLRTFAMFRGAEVPGDEFIVERPWNEPATTD